MTITPETCAVPGELQLVGLESGRPGNAIDLALHSLFLLRMQGHLLEGRREKGMNVNQVAAPYLRTIDLARECQEVAHPPCSRGKSKGMLEVCFG